MIRLQRNLSPFLDGTYRNENISNFDKIEYGHNTLIEDFMYHKLKQLKAHSTNQIDHNGSTLNQKLDRQDNRISNIVKGEIDDPGSEILDARVSMDGQTHTVLYDRLEHDFDFVKQEISRVENKFVDINFEEYNADNTGQTDVAPQLQDALDRIKQAKGGRLFIPAGSYLIHQPLIVYRNTTIELDNNATVLRGHTNELFMNAKYTDSYAGYEGNGNIHFKGGTLDHNYEQLDKYPDVEANMVNLMHAQNITFTDVRFRNTLSYHAIDANGIRNLKVTNCIFEGYINKTTQTMKESIQLSEYVAASIEGAGQFDGTPCQDVIITGCTFRPSDILGVPDVGVGNHLSVHNIWQSNITVTHNVFKGCKGAGVRPYKWKNVRIEGNTFESCAEGVRISSVGGLDKSANDINNVPSEQPQSGEMYFINGNIFKNYSKTGVSAFGQQYNDLTAKVFNIHINNNVFDCDNNDKGEGVNINLCANVHIKDNSFNYGYRGVRHTGCDTLFIDKNYFNNVKTEAIYNEISQYTGYAAFARHIHITSNLINVTGRNGIFIQYAKNFFVRDNTVTNTNQQTEDGNPRGGIYLAYCETGAVEGNHLWGADKDFAIRSVGQKNTTVFNNGGSGGVYVDGTDKENSSVIGYNNVNVSNEITKLKTKGV